MLARVPAWLLAQRIRAFSEARHRTRIAIAIGDVGLVMAWLVFPWAWSSAGAGSWLPVIGFLVALWLVTVDGVAYWRVRRYERRLNEQAKHPPAMAGPTS
jgi:hypothetical protein